MNRIPLNLDHVGGLADMLAAAGGSVTKDALLEYLRNGHLVMSARGRREDRVDTSQPAIPMAFFTDGSWVWDMETIVYVDRYDMPVPVGFVQGFVSERSVPGPISDSEMHNAVRYLLDSESVGMRFTNRVS
jgi:hypothetical protein